MQQSFPKHILYGADYNPEQWPETVWLDDMRLMHLASVNMVSVNIFSWAMLEPQQHAYHFDQLDRIMDILAEHEIAADLATGTASPPTWMSRLYPNMLPVTRDGKRLSHGSRQHYCPNSLDYRREAGELVRRLAERYAQHPALAMWHVNNEIGCHVSHCYCDRCAEAFRDWLQARYVSLDTLNDAWGTNFWSQRYYEWEDILPPRLSPAQNNPGQSLDYQRFMSNALLGCYLNEADILREITPAIPLTTNFMVGFKPADYFAWAPHLDIISFDNYPARTTPPWETALIQDLMRSLKKGQPHLVMEQTPSQLNWMKQNPHKRPGDIRLQSLQAVAHGADGVMYFQWRQSKAGAEKFHSAIVSHEGSERTRIFQQSARIGAELKQLSPEVVDSRISAQIAILMDWQNWWAVEYLPGPSDRLNYWEQLKLHYRPFHKLNVAIDFVEPTGDLSKYRVIVAPLLHMLRPGVARQLEQFVEQGGILLTTFFSGTVDQNDHVVLGGYPAELRKLLGIHVEEFDPWTHEMTNQVVIQEGPLRGAYPCTLWGELIHLEGGHALGTFASDYYAQAPALTVHPFAKGHVYYLATQASNELLDRLAQLLCQQAEVPALMQTSEGMEVTQRTRADGRNVYFLLNHTDQAAQVALPQGSFTSLLGGGKVKNSIDIAARDVVVLLDE
ncbi:MAG: beta-galactosidase [Ktedonobacteraceae bacterium]